MSRWRLGAFALFLLAALLTSAVYDERLDVFGADLPAWIVVIAAYVLGVFALYAQLRSEDRIGPKRR